MRNHLWNGEKYAYNKGNYGDYSTQTSVSAGGYGDGGEPGQRAVGYKCVTYDEPFLRDIFRENR